MPETRAGSFPRIFSERFLKVFGKSVDGEGSEVLVGNLSLRGKLFEIYFVRLIGTPNQHSNRKMPVKIGIKFSSSKNH